MSEFAWWLRWSVRYFPGHAYRRLRYCRHLHRGPFHDGHVCLTCAAPWFTKADA